MTIKETLKEANRYNDVMNVLKKILIEDSTDYPLTRPYVDEDTNKITWRINGKLVRKEALKLMESINDLSIKDKSLDDFNNLFRYVEDNSNCLLRNYAVTVSHKAKPDESIMEMARIWLVLWNLIICLNVEDPWTIPAGWKK